MSFYIDQPLTDLVCLQGNLWSQLNSLAYKKKKKKNNNNKKEKKQQQNQQQQQQNHASSVPVTANMALKDSPNFQPLVIIIIIIMILFL